MSGYLEVKYPFKSNLGLNPFKSWKKQWCILRPSPMYVGGGSLAVYCSEAGAPAGTVELRSGCLVKRAKSRSRPNAFAVFSLEDPSKPRILLAAQTLQEAQQWMDKIKNLLSGEKLLGTEGLLKDSYVVTVLPTDLSRKCELTDGKLTLSSHGILVTRLRNASLVIQWHYIKDVVQTRDGENRCCVISIDSGFSGGGELKICAAAAGELVRAVKQALTAGRNNRKLSRSDGDLSITKSDGDIRRSSWYSGPSEISLDDTDLVMSKGVPGGRLPRCGAGTERLLHLACTDDSAERRSLVSVSSGVYEEIAEEADRPERPEPEWLSRSERPEPEWPGRAEPPEPEWMSRPERPRPEWLGRAEPDWPEPTYESVSECVYATMRRARRPPPLPPRRQANTLKHGESWTSSGQEQDEAGVTRHSSLGSLTCAKGPRRQPFSVFRKRLKSDSRIATSPKSENAKESKDVETKKKRFDFTPTKDIFKSFKVSRKMKNLKITNGNLAKGETKSCEFLDETQHVSTNRCSKSVECLEGNDEFDGFEADLSLDIADEANVSALALPQEIVQLILRGRDITKVRLKENPLESEYMPMSPIVPPTPIDHYIVMSPKSNLA